MPTNRIGSSWTLRSKVSALFKRGGSGHNQTDRTPHIRRTDPDPADPTQPLHWRKRGTQR